MANAPSPTNVQLGRGAIYFDRRTTADSTVGSFHLGNCDQLSWNTATEQLDLKDFTQQSSSPYTSVVTSTDIKFTVAGFEFSKENWLLATMGDAASYTQSASTATGEVLASATVTGLSGKYFFLAKKKVSSVVLKQGATTYVLDTDYEVVDADRGIVRVLPAGSIADGTALTADYSYAAIATGLTRIYGGTNTGIEGKLRFVSNNATGTNYDLTVYNAKLVPNGDINMISDEFNKFTLEGTAQSDATGLYGGSTSSPYYELLEKPI
jgi:hypothetical protein